MHRRLRVFLFTFSALVLLASQHIFTAWADLPILSIDKVVAEVGDTVLVNITLSNVPSCGGWLVNLVWDPYYVTLTPGPPPSPGAPPYEVIEGPFMKDAGPTRGLIFDTMDDANGNMIVGDLFVSSTGNASGTGIIMIMNFTAIRAGTTTIEMRPLSSAENQSIVADASNHYVDHIEVNGLITVNARFIGDINGDSIVDIYDAVLLAKAFNSHRANYDYQGEPASPNWNPSADLIGDGVVDIYDAIILAGNFGKTA